MIAAIRSMKASIEAVKIFAKSLPHAKSLPRLGRTVACGLAFACVASSAGAQVPGIDPTTLPPGRPVRSNAETASAGRSPLAVRIAMADKVEASDKVVSADKVAPLEETVAAEAVANTTDPVVAVAPAPERVEAPATTTAPTAAKGQPIVKGQPIAKGQPVTKGQAKPTEDRRRLLGLVKEKLAEISQPSQPAEPAKMTERPARQPVHVPTKVAAALPVAKGPAPTDVAQTEKPAAADAVDQQPRPGIPRLVVDCEETPVEPAGGDTVTWRITVRNTGGPAHGVTASVFFAEGIEPVHASGAAAVLSPGEVRFDPIEELPTDGSIELLVTGEARQAGAVAYRVEAGCREVPGHAARESVVVIRAK